MTVVKEGSRYKLKSRAGKILGSHRTKKAAQAQERAIKASQAKRRGR